MNDSGCNNLSNEFVFPDEATTAKLLAVNTATKNLKRQHTTIAEVVATAKNSTSNLHNYTNTQNKTQNNETNELTEIFDINEASTSSSAFIATAGYSTRLFYGTSNNINSTMGMTTTTSAAATLPTHKSVIVSPQSQLKRHVNNGDSHHQSTNGRDETNVNMLATNNETLLNVVGGNSGANTAGIVATAATVAASVNNCSINNVPSQEDVNSLQAISSHETKKARRVQKSTRCLNNSGNKRK